MAVKTCSMEACDNTSSSRGLCVKHYTRLLRYGDPEGSAVPRPAGTSYETAHGNVRGAKGPASNYRCIGCGGKATEWSYAHSDPSERFDSKRGLLYSLDPKHYRPRCRSCHNSFDRLYQISRNFRTSNVVPAR